MPRWILYLVLVLVALTLVPMGLLYRSMHSTKSRPRIQVVYDMDQQFYYKPQTEDAFFPDDRASRHWPEGTVSRRGLQLDDAYYRGTAGADTVFVDAFPTPVTRAMVARGRERFNIYCAPCHGPSGNGDGLVNQRAQALAEGTWTPPSDLTSEAIAARSVGHIFNTITHGIRKMPAYGPQIPVEDRWAIVSWVRALQLSRNATIDDVPADVRATLEK